MARIELLHNIPAPYRVHLFNCLARSLAARGDSLHVHFFGANNPDRPTSWKRSLEDARFSYQVWDGYPLRIRGATLWFNPRLLWNLARRRPDILLHGGVWDSVTSLLATLLTRPRQRFAWMEFNVDIPGRSGGITGRAKRAMLARFDHILVPGAKGLRYLERYMGDDLRARAVLLPNVVDEARFRAGIPEEEVLRARRVLGADEIPTDHLLLIWPARLIGHKGILEFLRHVDPAALDRLAIRIIGEGPMKQEVLGEIERRGLGAHIRLVDGYVDYAIMPAVYRAGDALLLPSLHDPNPLSVIEALHSGLPLLLSNRIGNFEEAMDQGGNGFGFDPTSGPGVREALRRFRDLAIDERQAMGARSAAIAKAAWDSQACVDRAVAQLLRGESSANADRAGIEIETLEISGFPHQRPSGVSGPSVSKHSASKRPIGRFGAPAR